MVVGAMAGPRKAMLQGNFYIIICGYIFANLQFAPMASANTELSQTRDCTEVELEAVIDHDASRKENLARLSKQFFQSVNTIENCDREQNSDDAALSPDSESESLNANTDGANTASDGSGAANSSANNDATSALSEQMTAPLDSENSTNMNADNTATSAQTASGSLIGTNFDQTITGSSPAFVSPSASNIAGTSPRPIPVETGAVEAQRDTVEQDLRLTNGKTPDDIPDANNDSVFEAQIRAAAMAETDPDTKKKLWNEYRRYKGLPEQK